MDFLTETIKNNGRVDSRELLAMTFQLLVIAEESGKRSYEKIVQKNSSQTNLAKQLISLYYASFDLNYESMIYNFRKKYIENEAKVEYNDEDKKLELIGIGYMYDYIQEYNPSDNSKEFSIFLEGMKLHSLLYKAFDDKFKEEKDRQREEYQRQLEEAKRNRDLQEFKRVNTLLKSFSDASQSFGGSLRNNDVDLKGVDYHVPTASEAKAFFNAFLNPDKRMQYQNILSSTDLFGYIEYCVKTCVDIIKYQPFDNGNKRTARALLNLMFKNKNIPPVYIVRNERKPYKDALLKAIVEGDYTDIINFYYFKICDSIYELDILPYLANKKNEQQRIVGYKPRYNEVAEKEKDGIEEPDDSDVRIYEINRK